MINLSKIVAAVLVLLAIALGIYAWTLGRKPVVASPAATASAATDKAVQTFPAVFTVKPVPAGQPIPADALRIEQLPVSSPGILNDAAKATGRIPVFDLSAGAPILENQLVSGLALRVSDGERAVAIKADETMGVGNKIRPGDFVDVFLMLRTDNKEIDQGQARLLLARKRVLAYGNASVDGVPTATGQDANAQQQRNDMARTAVLAVPVDEVNRLTVGENAGRLILALRSPTDMSVPDPALFAELPMLLSTQGKKPGQPDTASLTGIDKAVAGLSIPDLANSGEKNSRAQPKSAPPARVAVARPAGNAATRPRPGNEVELIKGDKREVLSY